MLLLYSLASLPSTLHIPAPTRALLYACFLFIESPPSLHPLFFCFLRVMSVFSLTISYTIFGLIITYQRIKPYAEVQYAYPKPFWSILPMV